MYNKLIKAASIVAASFLLFSCDQENTDIEKVENQSTKNDSNLNATSNPDGTYESEPFVIDKSGKQVSEKEFLKSHDDKAKSTSVIWRPVSFNDLRKNGWNEKNSSDRYRVFTTAKNRNRGLLRDWRVITVMPRCGFYFKINGRKIVCDGKTSGVDRDPRKLWWRLIRRKAGGSYTVNSGAPKYFGGRTEKGLRYKDVVLFGRAVKHATSTQTKVKTTASVGASVEIKAGGEFFGLGLEVKGGFSSQYGNERETSRSVKEENIINWQAGDRVPKGYRSCQFRVIGQKKAVVQKHTIETQIKGDLTVGYLSKRSRRTIARTYSGAAWTGFHPRILKRRPIQTVDTYWTYRKQRFNCKRF